MAYSLTVCSFYIQILVGLWYSASTAMKAAETTKEDLNSLIVQLPEIFQSSIYAVLQKRMLLTVWKMFVIDRSFFLNALGTLLTYGILLGTFQKTNNWLLSVNL